MLRSAFATGCSVTVLAACLMGCAVPKQQSVPNNAASRQAVDNRPASSLSPSCLELYPKNPEDEAFLAELQHRIFNYFWNEVYPSTGIAIDHTENRLGKVAATGFELAAICIGVQRGWITYDQGYERTRLILDMFDQDPDNPKDRCAEGQFGLFWHFLDGDTGKMKPIDCVAMCDSADLIAGVVVAGEFFKDTEVAVMSQRIYDRVEWDRFVATHSDGTAGLLSFGWVPLHVSETYPDVDGLLPGGMGGLADNSLLIYALALGSDRHPIPQTTWEQYVDTYLPDTYAGYECIMASQLFCRQVPQSFIRFSRKRDRKMDYFLDTVNAILADRAFNIKENDYPDTLWGLTDCFGKNTYTHSAPPGPTVNDGTVGSTAFGGALPHVPGLSMAALRYVRERFGDRVWGRYGFTSSVNAKNNFVSPLYVGIEQGPLIMLIENYRTGLIWDLFSRSQVMKNFVRRAGFSGVVDDFELPPESPPYAVWTGKDCDPVPSTNHPQHGHFCLEIHPQQSAFQLTAQLTGNDLLAFNYDRYISLWTRDLQPLRCSVAIDDKEVPLAQAGSAPGLGWTNYYYQLPVLSQTSSLCAIRFEALAAGPHPCLDNVSCETVADIKTPGPTALIKAETGRLGSCVDLTWTAADAKAENADTYLLLVEDVSRPGIREQRWFKAMEKQGKAESHTVVLEPGKEYSITIQGRDKKGHVGPASPSLCVRANPSPLNEIACDFQTGDLCNIEIPGDGWTHHLETSPLGSGLRIDYSKQNGWQYMILPLDPELVALHRYLVLRVRGKVEMLGKLWCDEMLQRDLNMARSTSETNWTDLVYDTRLANDIIPGRDSATKLLLFPYPGDQTVQSSLCIQSLRYGN
ncbi:MAG: glucoamylase family protein [Lentisphaerota bacterium]